MRVLTCLHSFEPGGVERDALRFNDAWARAGVDVHIALGRTDGALKAEAPALPYTVFQTGRWSTRHFETLWMIARLPGLIRHLRPDVLFCAGNTYAIVGVATRLILGRRCPPIVLRVSNDLERRDMLWPYRKTYHFWLRLQARAYAVVVGMAEPIRAEIEALMRVTGDRLAIINNGSIRQAEAIALAIARDARVRDHPGRHFVSVGRLVPQKNFALLLRAFAAIAQPDDRMTIIGEGQDRASLESLIAQLGITDQVALPGHINPIGGQLAAADAFVLSSDYEGVAAVIIEALAAGLPIVATNCCVTMPMLIDEAGLLVAPGDVTALSGAMNRICTLQIDTAVLRARASGFTVEDVTDAWLALLDGVSAHHKP